ncbi:hypothetical protein ADK70_19090 [Streptomyces rimosus subsp. pseudoverticillatus]|uniref:hypothetical protein n=1 Tax=Streptomyces rimosus TaxID=1927 RepID=UPI0006B27544|nr:hypothetical protein [Streptomyces rimosus]KOT88354.1 hypothetical protein ADK70_19090 [Streptomyces rimosus subsp. pseudoverticillatus]
MAIPSGIVQTPSPADGQRVTVRGEAVGVAYDRRDVQEFLRRAGVAEDADAILLDDPQLVEWRGGGPEEWGGAEN